MAAATYVWLGTDAYEAHMGRWSRQMARRFLGWLLAPKGGRWLDVGCGTGALTEAVATSQEPAVVLGVDPLAVFVGGASARIVDSWVRFAVGDARALPVASGSCDAVVAGLVLNHVPDPPAAVAEMTRVARCGGVVGAYVWDYNGEMRMIRTFWEAVAATDPQAADKDPRSRYQICQPNALAAELYAVGLGEVEVEAIDMTMRFQDFDDFWLPLLMDGPSPPHRYVKTLGNERRTALREKLRSMLPEAADGSIELLARSWAARGTKVL